MKQYRLQFSLAATVLCLLASCSSSKQEGMKDITYTESGVKIMSALNSDSLAAIEALAAEITK